MHHHILEFLTQILKEKKYDPNFQYCTKWIDELQADGIYNLKEIVDVKKSRLEAIDRYKKCV